MNNHRQGMTALHVLNIVFESLLSRRLICFNFLGFFLLVPVMPVKVALVTQSLIVAVVWLVYN